MKLESSSVTSVLLRFKGLHLNATTQCQDSLWNKFLAAQLFS